MAFCVKCGKELATGAKFCFECGAPVGNDDNTVRRTVYSGEIRKCPSCGEVLQSMTAICPACGHEISSAKLSSTVKEFIDEINECDKFIANTHKTVKRSWKTWMKWVRVLWVFLNIFTLCIPLVIYLVFPLFKPLLKRNSTPELSVVEQRKVVLIENFTFPNDRESLLEALLFIKSKMEFISSGKINEKSSFWLRLWNTKATQLHQKTNILLRNDIIAEAAYSDIIACKKKVDKKIRIRTGLGLAIISIYVILVIVIGSFFKGITNLLPDNSGLMNFHVGEEFEWIETGLSTKIPTVEASIGKYITNSDTELELSVEKLTYSQFEKYISDCQDMGYTVEASKETDSYTAYNEKGYYLELQYYSRSSKLEINLKAPLKWPAHDIANMIPKITNRSGELVTADDEELIIRIYGVTDSWFNNYITECKNVGYSVEVSRDSNEYLAYSVEGYYLELHRYFDYCTIKLNVPFAWPVHNLTSVIPEVTGKTGKIETSTDEKLEILIYGVTENEFVTYIAECESKGFTIDTEKTENKFSGFNSTGHKLTITLEETKQLSIAVDAPMALTYIEWPSSGPATLIPKPSFTEGKISSDYDWAFSVYLREMTIEEFNDYVDKCIDNGFEKDYRSEHYFSADKGDDISLCIEYLGNNTVVIRIDDRSKLGD